MCIVPKFLISGKDYIWGTGQVGTKCEGMLSHCHNKMGINCKFIVKFGCNSSANKFANQRHTCNLESIKQVYKWGGSMMVKVYMVITLQGFIHGQSACSEKG